MLAVAMGGWAIPSGGEATIDAEVCLVGAQDVGVADPAYELALVGDHRQAASVGANEVAESMIQALRWPQRW